MFNASHLNVGLGAMPRVQLANTWLGSHHNQDDLSNNKDDRSKQDAVHLRIFCYGFYKFPNAIFKERRPFIIYNILLKIGEIFTHFDFTMLAHFRFLVFKSLNTLLEHPFYNSFLLKRNINPSSAIRSKFYIIFIAIRIYEIFATI